MSKATDKKLEEIHRDIKEIKEQLIPNLDKRIAIVEVKSGLWGGFSGLIAGILAAFTTSR